MQPHLKSQMLQTGLAQLVEHWSPKPGVRSSSLLTRAKPDFLVGFFCIFKLWRGDRVADCARLESVCTSDGTGGSNPPLSAELLSKMKQNPVSQHLQGFFMCKSVHKKAQKSTFRGGLQVD